VLVNAGTDSGAMLCLGSNGCKERLARRYTRDIRQLVDIGGFAEKEVIQ